MREGEGDVSLKIAHGRPPSRERWEGRRREVVDAAAHVFARQGYQATTIDDLVAATGLKRGGLYHYIDSKRELLIRIHERFIEPLLSDARRIAAAGEPPEATLRMLAHALMADIARYRDQVAVFLHEWRIIENDPEWEDVRRARREFEGVISDVLQRGVEEGSFRIADLRVTVLAFLGMINYSYQWYQPGGRMDAAGLAERFVDIVLDGIAVRDRPLGNGASAAR
jgi:AcrR family transcriptional regulator